MVRGFRVVSAGSERPIAQETRQLVVSTRAVGTCTYLHLGNVDSTMRCPLDVCSARMRPRHLAKRLLLHGTSDYAESR